jgi:hypothetical protein
MADIETIDTRNRDVNSSYYKLYLKNYAFFQSL